jgi:hypothetical protein
VEIACLDVSGRRGERGGGGGGYEDQAGSANE